MTDAEKIDNILELADRFNNRMDDDDVDLDSVLANIGSYYTDHRFTEEELGVAFNLSAHVLRFMGNDVDRVAAEMELFGEDPELVERVRKTAATARVFLRRLPAIAKLEA